MHPEARLRHPPREHSRRLAPPYEALREFDRRGGLPRLRRCTMTPFPFRSRTAGPVSCMLRTVNRALQDCTGTATPATRARALLCVCRLRYCVLSVVPQAPLSCLCSVEVLSLLHPVGRGASCLKRYDSRTVNSWEGRLTCGIEGRQSATHRCDVRELSHTRLPSHLSRLYDSLPPAGTPTPGVPPAACSHNRTSPRLYSTRAIAQ